MLTPVEGQCVECGKLFEYSPRRQGGGKRKKYCSHACCSRAWLKGSPEKRQAIITRYDDNPENKEAKRERTRKATLTKYGLTDEYFGIMLARQNGQCRGCLRPIDRYTARIDHNHATNIVRGLLCDSCNWALGHLRDEAATLRRLIAYLDHDPAKVLLYLIGALKNERIPLIGNDLRAEGYDVMDEWWTPGPHADEHWQEYERTRGRTYAEALAGRAATNIFLFDRSYIDLADIAVLVMPAGKSAMLELGYAKGRGKRTFILLDGKDPDRYDVMPRFADAVCYDVPGLIKEMKS